MRPKPPTTPIEDVRQRLNLPAPPTTTCVDCAQFDGERGFCTARELYTAPSAPSCADLFIPTEEDLDG